MDYTKSVYPAADDTWGWAVRDPQQHIVVHAQGYATSNAAEIAAARELCIQWVLAGDLRSDGERMTGMPALDHDRSLPLDATP
jgi:hypothetical protein